MRTEIGPIRLLKSSPRHCQGPPNIQKCSLFSHRGPYMKSWSFCLLYVCLHCDEVLIRWHFGTLDSANGPPGPPTHEQKSYFGFFTCRLILVKGELRSKMDTDYNYYKASRSHKYKYIFHNVIHIYIYIYIYIWNISCSFVILVHVSTLWWNVLTHKQTMMWNLF